GAEVFAEATVNAIKGTGGGLSLETFVAAGTSGMLTTAAEGVAAGAGLWLNSKFSERFQFANPKNLALGGGAGGGGRGDRPVTETAADDPVTGTGIEPFTPVEQPVVPGALPVSSLPGKQPVVSGPGVEDPAITPDPAVPPVLPGVPPAVPGVPPGAPLPLRTDTGVPGSTNDAVERWLDGVVSENPVGGGNPSWAVRDDDAVSVSGLSEVSALDDDDAVSVSGLSEVSALGDDVNTVTDTDSDSGTVVSEIFSEVSGVSSATDLESEVGTSGLSGTVSAPLPGAVTGAGAGQSALGGSGVGSPRAEAGSVPGAPVVVGGEQPAVVDDVVPGVADPGVVPGVTGQAVTSQGDSLVGQPVVGQVADPDVVQPQSGRSGTDVPVVGQQPAVVGQQPVVGQPTVVGQPVSDAGAPASGQQGSKGPLAMGGQAVSQALGDRSSVPGVPGGGVVDGSAGSVGTGGDGSRLVVSGASETGSGVRPQDLPGVQQPGGVPTSSAVTGGVETVTGTGADTAIGTGVGTGASAGVAVPSEQQSRAVSGGQRFSTVPQPEFGSGRPVVQSGPFSMVVEPVPGDVARPGTSVSGGPAISTTSGPAISTTSGPGTSTTSGPGTSTTSGPGTSTTSGPGTSTSPGASTSLRTGSGVGVPSASRAAAFTLRRPEREREQERTRGQGWRPGQAWRRGRAGVPGQGGGSRSRWDHPPVVNQEVRRADGKRIGVMSFNAADLELRKDQYGKLSEQKQFVSWRLNAKREPVGDFKDLPAGFGGSYFVGLHHDERGFHATAADGSSVVVSAEELGQQLRGMRQELKGFTGITLFACTAGADRVTNASAVRAVADAQIVADISGFVVNAPTGLVSFTQSEKTGESNVHVKADGEGTSNSWRTFRPRTRPNQHTTPTPSTGRSGRPGLTVPASELPHTRTWNTPENDSGRPAQAPDWVTARIRYQEEATRFDQELGVYAAEHEGANEQLGRLVGALWDRVKDKRRDWPYLGSFNPTHVGAVGKSREALAAVVESGNTRERVAMLFYAAINDVLERRLGPPKSSAALDLRADDRTPALRVSPFRDMPVDEVRPPLSAAERALINGATVPWVPMVSTTGVRLGSEEQSVAEATGGLVLTGISNAAYTLAQYAVKMQAQWGVEVDLGLVRLAMIGGLVPTRQHTVHEVMQGTQLLFNELADTGYPIPDELNYINGWARYWQIAPLSLEELRGLGRDGKLPDEYALGLEGPPTDVDDTARSVGDEMRSGLSGGDGPGVGMPQHPHLYSDPSWAGMAAEYEIALGMALASDPGVVRGARDAVRALHSYLTELGSHGPAGAASASFEPEDLPFPYPSDELAWLLAEDSGADVLRLMSMFAAVAFRVPSGVALRDWWRGGSPVTMPPMEPETEPHS
ncbi:hypothetical protein, partial [Streptomyces sp. NPDC060022]|uniref:hypothetical protein n=1 Tax=Streptomyces sp. NPDC060022 TaxID=3347039 RepID=UPI00369AA6D2